MPAAGHSPRASASNQMTDEPDPSCNLAPTALWPQPWLLRNRGSGVLWAGPRQSSVLQGEIPCLACGQLHQGQVSLPQPETPICGPCNPGADLELPRRAAHPVEWSQAAFFPVVRRPPGLRAARVCSGERRARRPPALPVRASVRAQEPRFPALLVGTVSPSQESETPVSCRCLSAPWQSHLCRRGPAERLPPALMSASKTAPP